MAIFERILKQSWGVVAVFSSGYDREFCLNQRSLADRVKNLQGYGLSTDEEQKAQVAMATALDTEKR